MKKTKEMQKGITLIALVITIIILLILAGISIMSLTNTGILGKAKEAKSKTEEAQANEEALLEEYKEELGKYSGGSNGGDSTIGDSTVNTVISTTENKEIKDAKGNKIVIPAGFKIIKTGTNYENTANNEITVDKGIVVEDATGTATNGSQFVWIPVGTITKADGSTTDVELGIYSFDTAGNKSDYSESCLEEDANNESALKKYGNTIAKNIVNFQNSVTTNGGFYIGRYEARKSTAGTITEVGTDTVWNSITQPNAATQARGMYDDTHPFTSDLVNSYAWDTATLFLQNCGDNPKYSRQNTVNSSFSSTGTNTQDTKDVQCNVYDMASNVKEWTTETCDSSTFPCIQRGGINYSPDGCTSNRYIGTTSNSSSTSGFRPLLYL